MKRNVRYSMAATYTGPTVVKKYSPSDWSALRGTDASIEDKVVFVDYKFNISGPLSDVVFTFTANYYDVDYEDELELIVNGTSIGYMPSGGDSQFTGSVDTTIPLNLLRPGLNTVRVLQNYTNASGTAYAWAVKDVSVSVAESEE